MRRFSTTMALLIAVGAIGAAAVLPPAWPDRVAGAEENAPPAAAPESEPPAGPAPRTEPTGPADPAIEARLREFFARHDRDRDGVVMREEFAGRAEMFRRLDANGDGRIELAEARLAMQRMRDRRPPGRLATAPTTQPADQSAPSTQPDEPALSDPRGLLRRPDRGPQAGQPAIDLTLTTLDGKDKVTLSEVWKDKPVVLIFGSYTCPPFRSALTPSDRLYERHKDRVQFYFIYIREAHTTDGWQAQANVRQGVLVRQPTELEQRTEIAAVCQSTLNLTMPMLIDDMEDTAERAYTAWPNRAYLIDTAGKVVYQGPRGPQGTQPPALGRAIERLLNR